MTSRPRWIWWSLATAALWAAWVTFAYLPLRHRDEREGALRSEWATKQHDMLARIETAPLVMMQTNDLGRQLDSAASRLPQAQDLRGYLDALADKGRVGGIQSVEVTPELASMMELTKSTTRNFVMIDTLVIELQAIGRFRQIGSWLDLIEVEPGFRHWRLCRWDKGEEPGSVKFSGTASFLVVVPGADAL